MEKQRKNGLSRLFFKAVRRLVRLFYGKMEIEGQENLPKNNAIIVANHAQMNGPIAAELFMPDNCYIWCAGQMMNMREVPEYAFNDFWSQKPKWTRPFYKLLSYIIAPLAACLLGNARTIAVYRDHRGFSTFKETIGMLKDNKNILIFPEKDETHNNILYEFQDKFVDIARLYRKRTGKDLVFVPMYIAPHLKKICICKAIPYDFTNDPDYERKRISEYLSREITDVAQRLPEHTVIPYRNIPKNHYLSNKDISEVPQ